MTTPLNLPGASIDFDGCMTVEEARLSGPVKLVRLAPEHFELLTTEGTRLSIRSQVTITVIPYAPDGRQGDPT